MSRGQMNRRHNANLIDEPKCYRQSLGVTAVLASVLLLGACSGYVPFDAKTKLSDDISLRVPEDLRSLIEVPYQVDEDILAEVRSRVSPAWGEERRTEAILDFIFGDLDLDYSLSPTRNAAGVFYTGEGNCLSFVNLFVGIARENRLNPFYVEVQDYHRWNYQQGVVVSRGHIVAGMYIDGELSTFDFLPYRAKSYRDFQPIDDLKAVAHFYNNLGAEALIARRDEDAYDYLRIATTLSPAFDKAINNLGVALLRRDDIEGAIALLERASANHVDNVPILTNLTRAYQQHGKDEKAAVLLDRLEKMNETSPFFFIYRGDVALGRGDLKQALDYMRRAFRTDSELPEVHVGLVRVYLALGQVDKAEHHVERALKLDATDEEARKYAALLAARTSR